MFRSHNPSTSSNGRMHVRRDPWILPLDPAGRSRLKECKQGIGSAAGGYSDHLALAAAYTEWDRLHGSHQDAFAERNFLSRATMAMIKRMRGQLLKELQSLGLVDHFNSTPASRHASDPAIVRCVLVRVLVTAFSTDNVRQLPSASFSDASLAKSSPFAFVCGPDMPAICANW
jgi:hypothetical protein